MSPRVAAAAALVAGLAAVPGVGHAAADPHVSVSRSIRAVPLDAGFLVEVVCTAQAHGTATTQVPVVTAVTCGIDDYSQTQAVPGSVAVVTLTSAVTGPFTLCVSAEATFLDPVAATNPAAHNGPACHVVHP